MCRSSLMRHDLIGRYVQHSGHGLLFPERISANPLRTVLIAASALTLFRRPDRALSSTPQSSL